MSNAGVKAKRGQKEHLQAMLCRKDASLLPRCKAPAVSRLMHPHLVQLLCAEVKQDQELMLTRRDF